MCNLPDAAGSAPIARRQVTDLQDSTLLAPHLPMQGRSTLLLGPPSCGKSTLMRVLANRLKGCGALDVKGEVRPLTKQGVQQPSRGTARSLAACSGRLLQLAPLVAGKPAALPYSHHLDAPARQVLYNGHTKDECVVERVVAFAEQARRGPFMVRSPLQQTMHVGSSSWPALQHYWAGRPVTTSHTPHPAPCTLHHALTG